MANCGLRIDVIASSPRRRPQAWLASAQAKQGGVCRKMVQAFSITQSDAIRFGIGVASSTWLQPGVCRACRPSDGRANQLRIADTLNMLNENDFPGTQAENFRVSLDVSVSADASVGLREKN